MSTELPTSQMSRVVITPEVAAEWLSIHSEHQRRLSPGYSRTLAVQMAAGTFRPTPAPVVLGPDGEVVDGQHRLAAVVESQVPLEAWVYRTPDASLFAYLDLGMKRTTAQFIDDQSRAVLATAARWVRLYEETSGQQLGRSKFKLPIDENLELVERMNAYELAAQIRLVYRETRVNQTVLLAVTWLGSDGVEPEIVEDWLRGIMTGANLELGDPRLTLRNRWAQHGKTLNLSGAHRQSWAFVVKSWNAHVTGEKLKLLRFGKDEIMPLVVGSTLWTEQNPERNA